MSTIICNLVDKFLMLRQQIIRSSKDVTDIPLNIMSVGKAGHMAVVGDKEKDLSLVFFDFSKGKDSYAELTRTTIDKRLFVKSSTLITALDVAIANLEWWVTTPSNGNETSDFLRNLRLP